MRDATRMDPLRAAARGLQVRAIAPSMSGAWLEDVERNEPEHDEEQHDNKNPAEGTHDLWMRLRATFVCGSPKMFVARQLCPPHAS